MKVKSLLAVPIALMLTACNNNDSSTKSKDSDGNCSTQFISDYNSIKYEIDNAINAIENNFYSYSEKVTKLKTAQNACKKFFSNHANVSCKAEVDYKAKQVHSSDWKNSCDSVENILVDLNKPNRTDSNNQNPSPQSVKSIEKPDDSKLVTDFKAEQIKLTILDDSKVKKSLNDVDFIIVNGRVNTLNSFKSDISNGSAICKVGSTDNTSWNSKIQNDLKLSVTLNVEATDENGNRRIAIMLEDSSLSLGCIKLNNKPFTMKEVREAVKGIIEVTVSK